MKRILTFSAKFAVAALVTFVCFEVYFRTTEISLPSFVVDDPVFGRTFKPNARATLVQEGFYMDRINEYGYLGPSYPPERTEGTLRVALIGDSFVEAFQVFPKWSLRSVLEAELTRRMGRPVEVLNFGRSGQDLRTMYTYYKDLVAGFQPDVTLFVVMDHAFVGNDNSLGPVCYLDEGGNLRVSYDFAQSEAYRRKISLRFTRQLGSYQLLQSAFYRYRQGETAQIMLDKFAPRTRAQNPGAPAGAGDSADPYLEINKAVLQELGRINGSGRSRILIVGHKEVPAQYVPLVEEAGLTFIDLRPELDELKRAGIDAYYWPVTNNDGHWNQEGQRFIGGYLAERLYELVGSESTR
jgi:hypothetical protein